MLVFFIEKRTFGVNSQLGKYSCLNLLEQPYYLKWVVVTGSWPSADPGKWSTTPLFLAFIMSHIVALNDATVLRNV